MVNCILKYNRSYIDNPGPMVVFATPGMLHGGLSLELFKRWCTNSKNMIIMPGYCVAGTVGNKILSGMREIELKPGHVSSLKLKQFLVDYFVLEHEKIKRVFS